MTPLRMLLFPLVFVAACGVEQPQPSALSTTTDELAASTKCGVNACAGSTVQPQVACTNGSPSTVTCLLNVRTNLCVRAASCQPSTQGPAGGDATGDPSTPSTGGNGGPSTGGGNGGPSTGGGNGGPSTGGGNGGPSTGGGNSDPSTPSTGGGSGQPTCQCSGAAPTLVCADGKPAVVCVASGTTCTWGVHQCPSSGGPK